MLASINGTDITKHIIASTYNVNNIDDYNEWKDGWHRKHRDVIRERVIGSFDLKFLKGTNDYSDFVSLVERAKVNGSITMQVYVSNKNIEKTIDAYCDFAPTLRKNVGMKDHEQFTFALEER